MLKVELFFRDYYIVLSKIFVALFFDKFVACNGVVHPPVTMTMKGEI